MLEIIIIILLIAALASLQTLHAKQRKAADKGTRMEIELFHIRQAQHAIEMNIRAFMDAFNKAVDTDTQFNHLRNATNDEALHKVAIEAVLLSRPGALTLSKKHARKNSH